MTSRDEEFKEGENQKTKQKRENSTGLFTRLKFDDPLKTFK